MAVTMMTPLDQNGSDFSTATTDRFAHVEVRGIDYIPIQERHGRPRELFKVWAASNVAYFYIILGGIMIQLGLNVWQATAVVLAGNLFWLLVGLLAVSGPSSGTPSSVVMRAMFGIRGNRINAAISGWAISVGYEAINLTVGALAGFALVTHLGIHPTIFLKLTVVLLVAIVTFTISVYGHATIVRLSGPITVVLMGCVAILLAFILPHVNLHFVPTSAPHGSALWAAACAGFTIIASGPLSWGTGADYARYLPPSTSARAVIVWTALGGFIPSALLAIVGILAGTVIDMTDPQTAFAQILPNWFYIVFLLMIIVGSITNNVLTAYSSGLYLQTMGIKARRSITVIFDGLAGVAIALYALFITNFVNAMSNMLTLSVALLGPSLAIYGMDIILRRNKYSGEALHIESPQGPFWYNRGFNIAGVVAQVVGTGVALICVDTPVFVGPVATFLNGADLSSITGPIAAAGVYAMMMAPKLRKLKVEHAIIARNLSSAHPSRL